MLLTIYILIIEYSFTINVILIKYCMIKKLNDKVKLIIYYPFITFFTLNPFLIIIFYLIFITTSKYLKNNNYKLIKI